MRACCVLQSAVERSAHFLAALETQIFVKVMINGSAASREISLTVRWL